MNNNRIAPFLWLHQESVEEVIAEIDRIYECGIYSVCLESRTYENFCKEQWWNDLGVIFAHCKKRNIQVWILDDKHFPSGYANGIYEEKYKNLRQRVITESHIDVCGPVKDGAAIVDLHKYAPEDNIVGVFAVKKIPQSDILDTNIIDLTENVSNGMVYFDLPEGVFRIVFVTESNEIINPHHAVYSDKMNIDSTNAYINEVYQPTYDKFSEYFGDTFLGFFADEPAFHNLKPNDTNRNKALGNCFEIYPWNANVAKHYSGDNAKNILKIWFEFSDNSHLDERVRYMDIITKLYNECYCMVMGDWCRKHNVSFIGHIVEDNDLHACTGSGAGHYFRALKGQDMSGIDVVLHQIMPGMTEYSTTGCVYYRHMNNNFFNCVLAKLASSYAHFDKTKNKNAMCEIFGAYGWAEGTRIMKYLTDHMLVRGINYFVPHAFSPKKNDTDCPPNFYDSGNNPQYRYFNQIMAYMQRAAELITQGTHISTCAILYDAELRWAKANFIPNEDIAKTLWDNQLDYDIIPPDVLGELENKDNINGEKYNALIVPYCKYYPRHIKDAIASVSIPVIYVSENGEKGTVALSELHTVIKADIKLKNSLKALKYCHRQNKNTDMYMFVNEDIHNMAVCEIELSGFCGGEYLIYDSFRNTYKKRTATDNTIKIELAPYNSFFVFTGELPELNATRIFDYKITEEETVNPKFNVSIEEQNSGVVKPYKTMTELENITSVRNKPDFSGHIYYDGEIVINNIDDKVILDLGYVGETAEVKVNGIDCGSAIIYPYEFDITAASKKGINHIEIMVSNHNGYKMRDNFSKFMLFEPSGLLGNIKLKNIRIE